MAFSRSSARVDLRLARGFVDSLATPFAITRGGVSGAAPNPVVPAVVPPVLGTPIGVSETQIDVTLSVVAGADSYVIYRDGVIAYDGAPTTVFNDTGRAPGASHAYSARARVDGELSAYSQPVTGSTLAPAFNGGFS